MTPTPQETAIHVSPIEGYMRPPPGEEVVISGISGIFPSSDNTTEFMENLFNNVDMVTEKILGFEHPEAPRHLGAISGINKFDAQFFKISSFQAASMEPQNRKLLEQAYAAVFDAGINPLSLKGKKVGVFVNSSYSDTASVAMYYENHEKGNILAGCAKNMFSNRISYWLDAKGPSYTLDCACTSSMVCLERAFNAMTMGECEAAIVGGCNSCQLGQIGLSLRRSNMLTLDGKTKCFDKSADGRVRAEVMGCFFLQKAKDAKRIYAEVYNAQVMYGMRGDEKLLPSRRSEDIEKFLNAFYAQTGVSPKEVDYVEAEGAANPEADANELTAIANVFGKDKSKPVHVGSVKSNMGDGESAAGICSVAKLCLAYHKGHVPANLHLTDPVDVDALNEGKVKVVTKNEPFGRGFTAVNQFSFAGTNCHTLLKGHYKPKDTSKYKSNVPRLVLISGRQEDNVKKIISYLGNQPMDPEVIGMLHNIFKIDTPGHMGRGYIVLDENEKKETVILSQNTAFYSGTKRPLWLVFSGMGSQWPGMAAQLMRIPTFAATIQRCQKVLEPFGVNLIRILTDPDKTIFDNILNCFLGITATQIGLIDVLKEIGVNPDFIIGHSQGEMGCAYWDETFTAEETILGSYYRGKVSLDSKFIKGAMAAVGMGYKDIKQLCPPEIDVACHNSNESATISGPADVVKKFVGDLSAKGIFAREVPSANIAYHSRYIQSAGPIFLQNIKSIISKPKLRSAKWVCTSIPQERWDEDLAKYSSAEYHTNNLMSPVYFEESAQLIPSNAVVVEVAPHGLLQAILKRSHPDCIHIPLTKRGHNDSITFFLEAIGKIYHEGHSFNMDTLYPRIQYPVSTETQMVSQLVEWEHSEEWPNLVADRNIMITANAREFTASVHDDEYKFFGGHIRDGVNVIPESGILFLVWETLAAYLGVDYRDLSVVFNDVTFHSEVIVPKEGTFCLKFMLSKGSDYFEVTHNKALFANGYVAQVSKPKFDTLKETEDKQNGEVILTADDIYKHLHAKGITYRNELQSIHSTNLKRNVAQIKYTENWIVLLDSLIQLNLLTKDHEGVSVPKVIQKLTINADIDFKKDLVKIGNELFHQARHYNVYDVTRCGGIEIKHVIFEDKPVKEKEPDVLQSLVFIPNINMNEVNINTALQVSLQIVADNIQTKTITLTEVISDNSSLANLIEQVAENIPDVNINTRTVDVEIVKGDLDSSNLVLLSGTITRDVFNSINPDSFILLFGQNVNDFNNISSINVLSSVRVQGKDVLLLKIKNPMQDNNIVKYILIDDDEKFSWVSNVDDKLQNALHVVLVSQKQPQSGIFDMVKNLKKMYPNKIGLVIIDDKSAPKFHETEPVFRDQLEKNLTFNVLQEGRWGSYYYLQNSMTTNVQNFKLVSGTHSDFESLTWAEEAATEPDNNTVQVCFAGVSIKDLQNAVGLTGNDKKGFGSDFSGFDAKGRRVMGFVSDGAVSSKVEANPNLLWPVPEHWTLEEAASVPAPYVLAYYTLGIKSQVMKDHLVFVNGGVGALGQAVISICLTLGCEVFTCVSDKQKKEFLLKLFPKLKENNVGCSQNGDFTDMVKSKTNGKGCQFVINCSTGHQRHAAMKCLAQNGMFMDVNDFDWTKNKHLGMSFITADRTYRAVQLSSLLKLENVKEQKAVQYMIAQGITNGSVRPLSRVIFAPTEVTRAFRLLALNKNKGRALIKIRDSETSTDYMKVLPRPSYSTVGTYVVICDETELGIELANLLVMRGARKLLLNLKSKKLPGLLHIRLESWNKLGAQVKIVSEKINTVQTCGLFLNEAEKLGRVQGIYVIQGSTATKDRLRNIDFINVHENSCNVVANLDVISRNNCHELSNFVVISRTSENAVDEYFNAVSGNICQARVKAGLPALNLKAELMDEVQRDNWNDIKLQPQNVMTFVNAIEISLMTKQSNIRTYNVKREGDVTFLEKVAKSLGLKDLEDVDPKLTIKDFILNDVVLEELKTILKDTCKIEFVNENLRDLSIESLKSITNIDKKASTAFDSGLGTFYSFIDPEIVAASYPFVEMRTVLNRYKIETYELDKNATHLLLIPGFEGHNHIFEKMCERLKVRAMTYQLPPDLITTIPEMALNIFENIKKTFVFKSKFYLLGYSFGVNVAFEVAALLEKEGHVGTIVCLDSSPDALRVQLDAYIGDQSDKELQNSIIKHLFHLMSGEKSTELLEEIEKLENWSDKVNSCVSKLKKLVSYNILYMQNFIESAYRRIQLAKTFSPNLRLNSELVLLKGIPHPNSGNLDSDYGLSKYTKKPVKVFDLALDHASVTQDCRVSNIINQLIDPELLEDCKSKICQTYNLN